MKLLFITTGYLPMPAVSGGAVNTLLNNYIDSNKNHKITVYSINPKEKINDNNTKAEYRYIYKTFSYKLNTIIRGILNKIPFITVKREYIRRVIKDIKCRNEENKYDFVILENTPLSTVFLNKIFKDKVILHLHNDYLNKNTKGARKIIESCHSIFCVSKFIENRVQEIIPNEKTSVLYNGINIDNFTSKLNKEDLRKKYGFKNNDKIILYVGRLLEKKGIFELIRAFTKLNFKNTKLLIVGNGSKNIKKKINSLLNDNIKVLEYIPNSKINEIYSIADIGVVPSKCNEAFGLTVIEGLASNLKMIVTNDGAIPELVENQNSIIIDKNNLQLDLEESLIKFLNENVDNKNNIKLLKERFDTKVFVRNFNKLIKK